MSAGLLNIGEAAKRSGVSAKMLRHYESLGLLGAVARTESGYRQYAEADVHTLRFIRRARDLGFSVDAIADLLALWRDRARPSAGVKAIAQEQIADLRRRIAEMEGMARTLEHLAEACCGDARPECPILDDLAAPDHGPTRQRAIRALAKRGR
jgi:Cu(I)-responsive transcriptional regulator